MGADWFMAKESAGERQRGSISKFTVSLSLRQGDVRVPRGHARGL